MFLALDHGIASVRDSGGPLIPFAITDRAGERQLARFMSERLEAALEQALQATQTTVLGPNDRVVVVYDGYLTVPGAGRTDAIYAESLDATGRHIVMAQRYKPKGFLRGFATVGNPALLPPDGGRLYSRSSG